MAEITSIELANIPETIVVGDNITDITAKISVEWHPMDLSLNMEYLLHIYVYEIHGKVDVPVVIPNWKNSTISPLTNDRSDEFLGEKVMLIKADSSKNNFVVELMFQLGKLNHRSSFYAKKLEAFAVLIPAIGIAAKWSNPYHANIEF